MGKCHQLGTPDVRGHIVMIYALVDPRDSVIRYVGRSQDPWTRLHSHARGVGANRRVKAWCRGLIDEGRLPIVQILKVVHPGENADDYEYMAIRALRRREDQLLNDFSVEIRARHKRLGGVRPYARRATTVQMNTPERAARCAVAQPTDQGSAARLGTEACGREMRSQNISHPLSGSALTARQSQVLETIRAYLVAHGYAPTVRELGALIGVSSTNAVMDHLKALERKGAIVRGGRGTHVPRRIQVQ